MANTFSSLFGNPRGKRGAMMIVIGVTAALLVISLLVLGILGIVNAVRNRNVEEEPPAPTNGIPAGFVTTTFAEGQLYNGNLILVNDTYAYTGNMTFVKFPAKGSADRPKTEAGEVIYSIQESGRMELTQEAMDAFNLMMKDFCKASPDDSLYIASRDPESTTQDPIFHCGMTVSLQYYVDFANDPSNIQPITGVDKYSWIFTNAYKYGFVQLFEAPTAQSGESETETASQEHIFRYVGTVHAKAMQDKKIKTFDAYLTYLRDNTSATKNLSVNAVDKKTYKVYYIAGDAQQVIPEKYKDSCVISGDNMSGYIVTYCTTTTTK